MRRLIISTLAAVLAFLFTFPLAFLSTFLLALTHPAMAREAPKAHDAPAANKVCGRAWASLGYADGGAGRALRAHPFGDREAAAKACRAAGFDAPDFDAYRAQHGAAQFLSGRSRSRRESVEVRRGVLGEASRSPALIRPDQTPRARRETRRQRTDRIRRERAATLRERSRLDARRFQLEFDLSRPNARPEQRPLLRRQLREAERERRALDSRRPPPTAR